MYCSIECWNISFCRYLSKIINSGSQLESGAGTGLFFILIHRWYRVQITKITHVVLLSGLVVVHECVCMCVCVYFMALLLVVLLSARTHTRTHTKRTTTVRFYTEI